MKIKLLFAAATTLTLSLSGNAQQRMMYSSEKVSVQDKRGIEENVKETSVFPASLLNNRRVASGENEQLSSAILLGTAASAIGVSGGSKSNLWYDPAINTIVFTHRSNGDPTTGYYRYDISTDGGNVWTSDLGPVYSNPNDSVRGRYPIGVIYNPLGNTNPSNAFLAYTGPWNRGSGWKGRVYGVSKLDLTGTTQHHDQKYYTAFPENMFVVKSTGDLWVASQMYMNDSINNGMDSIVISHGVWNSTTNDFDFTEMRIPFTANSNFLKGANADIDIAFDDAGQTGYIALIANIDSARFIYPDSLLHLSVLKTTDGGFSWAPANACSFHPDIIDVSTALDSLLANDTSLYAPGFDLDIVVDANSNLHILTSIHPSGGFTVVGDGGSGTWGMFDVFTDDQGSTWKARFLDKPLTFRGKFGDGSITNPLLNEDARPFASRSWDGTKLFFSWFDTDTVIYGVDPGPSPKGNNKFPDLHCVGYNVTTGLYTEMMNLTKDGDGDGQCAFGNGSYYVIDSALSGNVFSIPAVYQQLQDPLQTGSPTAFWYIQNANVNMTLATNPGNAVSLPCAPNHVSTVRKTDGFMVSANYPNPFNGKTSLDVNLVRPSDLTAEVTNLLGEVLTIQLHSRLSSGFHTLTFDCTGFSSGIYFCKVFDGSSMVTRKIVVQ